MEIVWDIIVLAATLSLTPMIPAQKPRITLRGGGAQLAADVYQVWKPVYQAYRSKNAIVDFRFDSISSSAALKKFRSGEYDFAGSDVEITSSMLKENPDYLVFPAMAGSIAVAYNMPELKPCRNATANCTSELVSVRLSKEALVGIFNGTVSKWNDPLLTRYSPDLQFVNRSIVVIVRGDASGLTQIFTRALSRFDLTWNKTYSTFSEGCNATTLKPLRWNSSMELICGMTARKASSLVLNTPYSIGYMSSYTARDFDLPMAPIQASNRTWTVPDVQATADAIDAAKITVTNRSIGGFLIDTANNISYPISAFTYIVLRNSNSSNCNEIMELYRLFDYVLTDPLTRSISTDFLKAPLNEYMTSTVRKQILWKIRCGGKYVKDLVEYQIDVEEGRIGMWKLPTGIVLGLLAISLLTLLITVAAIQYHKSSGAFHNKFVIGIEPDMNSKSTTSIVTKTTETDPAEWLAFGYSADGIYHAPGHEPFLLRDVCAHIAPLELMLWRTRLLLMKLTEHHNRNVLQLMGITMYNGDWKYVTPCPSKGRLGIMLQSGKIHLDATFRYSIARDIAEGMSYLHRHGIVHGQLMTNYCYIDSHWNVLVGDWEAYALHLAQKVHFHAFEYEYFAARANKNAANSGKHDSYYKLLFFSSPESLTKDSHDAYTVTHADKHCDVFSYSMILYELFSDIPPYEDIVNSLDKNTRKTPEKILSEVAQNDLRPVISTELVVTYKHLHNIITTCWEKIPTQRMTFYEVERKLRRLLPRSKGLVDSMMKALEEYSSSLEERIEEKAKEYENVAKNMETLMHSMLPAPVATKISNGQHVEPEYFDMCTVLFADIANFTRITGSLSPPHVTSLLNHFCASFDETIKHFDIFKANTTGDSYMCVSGAPIRNGNKHAAECATVALDMMHIATLMADPQMPEKTLRMRAGLHTGPLIAGIVGGQCPRYCYFGDTVQMALLVKNTSLPTQIQVSGTCKFLLDVFGVFELTARGMASTQMDGPGVTYWLVKREGHANPTIPDVTTPIQDEVAIQLFRTNSVSRENSRLTLTPRSSQNSLVIPRSPSRLSFRRTPSRLSITHQGSHRDLKREASKNSLMVHDDHHTSSVSRRSSANSLVAPHSPSVPPIVLVDEED